MMIHQCEQRLRHHQHFRKVSTGTFDILTNTSGPRSCQSVSLTFDAKRSPSPSSNESHKRQPTRLAPSALDKQCARRPKLCLAPTNEGLKTCRDHLRPFRPRQPLRLLRLSCEEQVTEKSGHEGASKGRH